MARLLRFTRAMMRLFMFDEYASARLRRAAFIIE